MPTFQRLATVINIRFIVPHPERSQAAGLFRLMQVNTRNIAIVCNQLAGAGRAVSLANRIVDELSNKETSYCFFKETWPPNFTGFTDVWIIGGDGTLNYFVNQYPDINLPLVIFNGGTGNDFHWMLYGKITFEEQMQIALSEVQKELKKLL